MNYSISEQLTNDTWIDGSPVYSITIEGDSGSALFANPTYTIIHIEKAVSINSGNVFTDKAQAFTTPAAGNWIIGGPNPYEKHYFTIRYIKTGI